MTTEIQFRDQLIRHEGLRLKPYKDTEGILTIGVGHNLEEHGISHAVALQILAEDIAQHRQELEQRFPQVKTLDAARYYVLLNMAFNLGIHRLGGFRNMWAAIGQQNWPQAADEMLDSKWAGQVGRRANELADIMRTGVWPA